MPDGATTKRRNCADQWKCQWYAIYRSMRFRKRFGDHELSRRAVIDAAIYNFQRTVANAERLAQ